MRNTKNFLKRVRRKNKKNHRAKNFDELEEAFFNLVQKHNILSRDFRILQAEVVRQDKVINDPMNRKYC